MDRYLLSVVTGVKQLRYALFRDLRESYLKFPSCLISLVDADEEGRLIFSLRKPYADMSGFSTVFPVQLQFFNKNYHYYIIVSGLATMSVGDEDEQYKADSEDGFGKREVVIAFTISHATCGIHHLDRSCALKAPIRYLTNWLKQERVVPQGEFDFYVQ